MKDSKKTLLISGIICLVSGLFDILALCLAIFDIKPDTYTIVINSLYVFLSITTGIIYLCVMGKPTDWLVKNRILFVVLMFLNIINGLVVWLVSFWVEIVITEQYRIKLFNQNTNKPNENGDITLHDNDYEITSKVDFIKSEIEKLDEMKRKNQITEEEYNRLREEIINKNL